jgi:hypothetical protein
MHPLLLAFLLVDKIPEQLAFITPLWRQRFWLAGSKMAALPPPRVMAAEDRRTIRHCFNATTKPDFVDTKMHMNKFSLNGMFNLNFKTNRT